jgi:hypothetical protein
LKNTFADSLGAKNSTAGSIRAKSPSLKKSCSPPKSRYARKFSVTKHKGKIEKSPKMMKIDDCMELRRRVKSDCFRSGIMDLERLRKAREELRNSMNINIKEFTVEKCQRGKSKDNRKLGDCETVNMGIEAKFLDISEIKPQESLKHIDVTLERSLLNELDFENRENRINKKVAQPAFKNKKFFKTRKRKRSRVRATKRLVE